MYSTKSKKKSILGHVLVFRLKMKNEFWVLIFWIVHWLHILTLERYSETCLNMFESLKSRQFHILTSELFWCSLVSYTQDHVSFRDPFPFQLLFANLHSQIKSRLRPTAQGYWKNPCQSPWPLTLPYLISCCSSQIHEADIHHKNKVKK